MSLSCSLLHAGILTDNVVVELGAREWWTLWTAVGRELGLHIPYDGRGPLAQEFMLAGITFRRRPDRI